MQVTATDGARAAIARCRSERAGELTITIGTGCCESTAPFLYEDFWPGPDQEIVGTVDGISIFAPEYLRASYPGDDGMVIDVITEPAESLSIETEHGVRLILRGQGVDLGLDDGCVVEACTDPVPERERTVVTGTVAALPPHLQGVRLR